TRWGICGPPTAPAGSNRGRGCGRGRAAPPPAAPSCCPGWSTPWGPNPPLRRPNRHETLPYLPATGSGLERRSDRPRRLLRPPRRLRADLGGAALGVLHFL